MKKLLIKLICFLMIISLGTICITAEDGEAVTNEQENQSENSTAGDGNVSDEKASEEGNDDQPAETVLQGVASADGVGYETLQAAINAGGEVALLADVTESITIAKGKIVTIDLNGHTLTGERVKNTPTILNNGTLVIMDSKETGIITRNSDASDTHYVIDNQGTMNIESGTIQIVNLKEMPDGASLIRNAGGDHEATLNISGGTIHQTGFIAVKNDDYGILNITGGTIGTSGDTETHTADAVQNWHIATIENATIGNIRTSVWDDKFGDSVTTIKAGTVLEGKIQVYVYTKGVTTKPTLNIEGGEITINDLYVDSNSVLNITGGEFNENVLEYVAKGYTLDKGDSLNYKVVKTSEETEATDALSSDEIKVGNETVKALLNSSKLADGENTIELEDGKEVKLNIVDADTLIYANVLNTKVELVVEDAEAAPAIEEKLTDQYADNAKYYDVNYEIIVYAEKAKAVADEATANGIVAYITETPANVKVALEVEGEINTSKYKYTFVVYKLHNGEVTEIKDFAFDANTNEISFTSNEFSTYCVSYSETEIPNPTPTVSKPAYTAPSTGID